MNIPDTAPEGVKIAFRKGGWGAVERKYRVTQKNEMTHFLRRKTEVPLPGEGYTNQADLPDDVQELPGSATLYWMECYNFALSHHYPEKAKDAAWKAIKKRYYNKKGAWRMKMENLEKVGSFKASMIAKVRKVEKDGEPDQFFIEGKASDTSIDLEDDRMGPEFIKTMRETAVGLNLYVDHDHTLDKTIGVIVESDGDDDNFFIKARLESPESNSHVASIISKSEAGIQIGFSIGGRILKAVKQHAEEIGRAVRTIVKGVLAEVSVTTMPANPNARTSSLSLAKSLHGALDDLEEDGTFDPDDAEIIKILEEVFEMDQVRAALSRLTWSFIDLTLDIVHSDDLAPGAKQDKIIEVSSEFATAISSLSTKLADFIAGQDDFLEASEAA
jgi:HK97 family phage prohead protease